jgi:protein-S-isoprenylcysteine O-methyltransferase Ste14
MSGWRIDHLTCAWVVGGALSLTTAQLLIARRSPWLSLSFFAFSLLFYYGGNTAFLLSRLPARMIARWGEDRAFRVYESILALMFINQGLGIGCVGALPLGPRWLLPGSPLLLSLVGAALCAVGITVKVWATIVAGVDIYYYRDMFLGRPVSEFVVRGPYRVLRSPMYGVGQLHAYGVAVLMSRSWSGLLAAAVCHALIYAFYFTAELPFIQRTYLARADAAPSPESVLTIAPRSDG